MCMRVILAAFLATAAPAACFFTPTRPAARGAAPRRAARVVCQQDDLAVSTAEEAAEAPPGPEGPPKGRFLAYVKNERDVREWKKANPVDPIQTLKGPATSVAILTAGFYTIPLVKGIAEGVRAGDVAGSAFKYLGDPTSAL
mmetsp:Transcript_25201/g.75568  ORF Transcript_25201/g.75568 Transcript_25201/m.75568 type:complete len:142 (-) Transcript_25201:132-557(-)